jgi:hypothetical protein
VRKLKIIEHISLDGVIQRTADDDNFPYIDWNAPYRTPAGRDSLFAACGGSFDLVSTKAMPSGIIFSTYKVAGPLKNG